MSNIVSFRQENGKLGVLFPVDTSMSIDEIIKKDLPKGTEYKIVESIKVDNDFFNCYYFDVDSEDGALFDPDLAKEVWKNHWRNARTEKFKLLDIEFMRALERGDKNKLSDIAEQKTLLRDVTELDIDGNTPEEIKAVWPEILK